MAGFGGGYSGGGSGGFGSPPPIQKRPTSTVGMQTQAFRPAPNNAGKSTLSSTFLDDQGQEVMFSPFEGKLREKKGYMNMLENFFRTDRLK